MSYVDETSFNAPSQRAGLAVIGTAGLLSALSTFILMTYFAYCHFQTRVRGIASPLTSGITQFTSSALGKYLVYLILCDFLQGSAFVANYHWARMGSMVESSRVCMYQGAVSQVGDLGAALWSNVIAFQTFSLLFIQRKPPNGSELVVTFIIWAVIILLPILGPVVIQNMATKGPFWGLSGAWCWVGNGYQLERLMYLYVWVFLNLFCCFTIYSLIYLKFAGVVEYAPGRWCKTVWHLSKKDRAAFSHRLSVWHLSSTSASHSKSSDDRHHHSHHHPHQFNHQAQVDANNAGGHRPHVSRHAVKIARRLMWYPIVYAAVTIPVAICRLGVLAGWTPPFWLFVFAGTLFSSSGLSNTLLFLFTRHSFIQRSLNSPAVINITTTRQVDITVDEYSPRSAGGAYPLRSLKSPGGASVVFADTGTGNGKSTATIQQDSSPFRVDLSTHYEQDPTGVISDPPTPDDKASLDDADRGDIDELPTALAFDYYSHPYREPIRNQEPAVPPSVVLASPRAL